MYHCSHTAVCKHLCVLLIAETGKNVHAIILQVTGMSHYQHPHSISSSSSASSKAGQPVRCSARNCHASCCITHADASMLVNNVLQSCWLMGEAEVAHEHVQQHQMPACVKDTEQGCSLTCVVSWKARLTCMFSFTLLSLYVMATCERVLTRKSLFTPGCARSCTALDKMMQNFSSLDSPPADASCASTCCMMTAAVWVTSAACVLLW